MNSRKILNLLIKPMCWVWPENAERDTCHPCYTPSASVGEVHPVIDGDIYREVIRLLKEDAQGIDLDTIDEKLTHIFETITAEELQKLLDKQGYDIEVIDLTMTEKVDL